MLKLIKSIYARNLDFVTAAMKEKKPNKALKGRVINCSADGSNMSTCTVVVQRRIYDPFYKKVLVKSKRFCVVDFTRKVSFGDTVEFIQSRPLSKRKSWKINRILKS
mmetsp:Transcript_93058/g.175181  ORF Transcript_93058/g.175181 Transcript_93058/m.175181 type:complete len:107 (+) Transcript_93058:447-767(+)